MKIKVNKKRDYFASLSTNSTANTTIFFIWKMRSLISLSLILGALLPINLLTSSISFFHIMDKY